MHAVLGTHTSHCGILRPHVRSNAVAAVAAACLVLLNGAAGAEKLKSPLAPDEAQRSFVLHPGLRIELVAAEPQVIDPVAMAFDEEGRLWVAEMGDYPFGPKEGEPARSRIKLLEDLDSDGYFETAHIFAENLLFATGVMPWRDGVIVTFSGEIAWLADTDGDHRADVNETWFRGFAERNPQLRANDPTLWFDGNVYVAGGLFYGGKIATVHGPWQHVNGTEPIDLGSRDFRFDPRTGRAERIAGGAQFGIAFDVYGHRFVCSNSRPLEHVVLEERHLNRNPHAGVTKTNHIVVRSGDATPLHALSRQETTSYLHEGQFTAACGAVVFGGDALSATFRGNAFVCEPTASLVHREVLRREGASFAAEPGRKGVEFLASTDSWFRPVFLGEGPDGALYVVDMYRAVIEHPDWFPDLAQRSDLTDGNDRGRIWRIVENSANAAAGQVAQRLDVFRWVADDAPDLDNLAAGLDHPNAWHRTTAARLLFERADDVDAGAIREVLHSGTTAAGRVAALYLLDGLGTLTSDDLLAALAASDPLERRAAVRIAESYADEDPAVRRRIAEVALVPGGDAAIVFQSLLALGGEADNTLCEVIHVAATSQSAGDEWLRTAVLAEARNVEPADLHRLCAAYERDARELDEGRLLLVRHFAQQIALTGSEEAIRAALQPVSTHASLDRARLLGVARGLPERKRPFREWIAGQSETWQNWWRQQLDTAVATAGNRNTTDSDRRQALAILELASYESVSADLARLLGSAATAQLRTDVVRTMGRFDHPRAAALLLARLSAATPGERRTIFDAVLSGRASTEELLDQIEAGSVEVGLLDAGSRQRLLGHPRDAIRTRAGQLLAGSSADLEAVIASYEPALHREGDAVRGRAAFERHCAACHRVDDIGAAVGPDVADNYNRTREQLLVAILDPNRAIDSSYEAYVIVTTGGRTLQGLLAGETAAAVSLKDADGNETTIARDEIEELRPTGMSFMPSGLEKDIDVDAMADLLTFLKTWRDLR